MTQGLLLDSHSLLWLEGGAAMGRASLEAIDKASLSKNLFVSHITIWELGVAINKKSEDRRPHLRGLTSDRWFHEAVTRLELRALSISARIAMETANVPAIYGSGDPGDCFLIATARVRKLSLVTRDRRILQLASEHPAYLHVVPC